jgi:CheY-like chemotaxis protein
MTPAPGCRKIPPKRILIVEDEPLVAHTLRLLLAADGHTLEIAGNGEQGLAMFEAAQPDLVITDFKMPKMDGLELAEAIKRRSPATPVILLTAYVEAIERRMGKVSHVDFLIGKPFSAAQLREGLNAVFPQAAG